MKLIKIAKNKSTKEQLEKAIENYKGDRIKGGKSDKMKVSDFPRKAIEQGIKVELEHTNNVNIALEIVMDHLSEDKKYYDKLKKMESK